MSFFLSSELYICFDSYVTVTRILFLSTIQSVYVQIHYFVPLDFLTEL